MITLLRFIDSGPYHARTAATVPFALAHALREALAARLVTSGRYGFTLTLRGFYAAFPEFTTS